MVPPALQGHKEAFPALTHLLICAVSAVSHTITAPGLRHAFPTVGTDHLTWAAQQRPGHGTALLIRAVAAIRVPITAQSQGHALPTVAGEFRWAALLRHCGQRQE